jgi:hypothetical protein
MITKKGADYLTSATAELNLLGEGKKSRDPEISHFHPEQLGLNLVSTAMSMHPQVD